MKNALLLLCVFVLCVSGLQAQTFNDYILSVRGDSVVVKDFIDMGAVANSLPNAIERDSIDNGTVPAGRVYLLRNAGIYWNTIRINSPFTRAIKIEGELSTPLVQIQNDTLPTLCGTDDGTTSLNGDLIVYRNDVTVKNMIALPASTDGTRGWTYFTAGQPGNTLTLDNVLMEHTRWVLAQSNDFDDNSLVISNSYFVNLIGQPCRRNGGVYDNVSHLTDNIIVENTTHIMAQGMMYKFRNYPINKAFFNHNTFVNCSGQLFETFGFQSNWTVTNNLFVNSNVQPYRTGLDLGETDQDELPHGIINVDTLPSSMSTLPADRKILVDRNGLYWDARIANIHSYCNTNAVDGFTNWVTQAIKMNDRTQTLFNDNSVYTHLTEGGWVEGGDPVFVSPADLMTTQVDELVTFSDSSASESNTYTMVMWRVNRPIGDYFTYPDWPIPVNLAYTNAAYTTAALNNFPLGDLNWFPTAKTTWEAQKDAEHAELQAALDEGRTPVTGVDNVDLVPDNFALQQNFPNPFNPSTTITFTMDRAADVSLKVFDMLGREIATLVNGHVSSGVHSVQFDAKDLSSGIYFYKLTNGVSTQMKKMTLVK